MTAPRLGRIYRLAVDIQPVPKRFQTVNENWRDHSIAGRADVDQNVPTTAARKRARFLNNTRQQSAQNYSIYAASRKVRFNSGQFSFTQHPFVPISGHSSDNKKNIINLKTVKSCVSNKISRRESDFGKLATTAMTKLRSDSRRLDLRSERPEAPDIKHRLIGNVQRSHV